MNPKTRRVLITTVVLIGVGFILMPFFLPKRQPTPIPAPAATSQADDAKMPDVVEEASADETESPSTEPTTTPVAEEQSEAQPSVDLTGLHAAAPGDAISPDNPPSSIGSFDWRQDRMEVQFASNAAGIQSIRFSDLWETAPTRRLADRLKKQVEEGTLTYEEAVDELPDEERYTLIESGRLNNLDMPVLGAHSIVVNGETVLLGGHVWSELAPGHFVTEVRDELDQAVLRIERRFTNPQLSNDLTITQRIFNLTEHQLTIAWRQLGPPSLRLDRSRYMDRRRFRFGYGPDIQQFPEWIESKDNKLLIEHTKVIKSYRKSLEPDISDQDRRELLTLWPNNTSRERSYELAWFGATNRYFALTVHPVVSDSSSGDIFITDIIDEIRINADGYDDPIDRSVYSYLFSPELTVAPQAEVSLDLGVYAGPLSRHVLEKEQPYQLLAMDGLILYQMSSCCAICTFQWLAHGLLWFLSLLHDYILFDWALAIVGLVIVVRALLHPITKRSQVNMQRFSKVMGSMKPELDKLQKKHGGDPKRMQQEQMKLMREQGINPFQVLGCLPMFLQMPIWIALYAMLYFVFDLRQQPGFFGMFQLFWDWPFLADLSSADHFFGEFKEPIKFLMWNVTGINLLPILMGVIFFIQQKYMTPPTSATMTPEQQQQQKIMKVMMVVMFPVMLYSAPSGLTLYILTSSCIGILESKYVRAHIKEMDLNPKGKKKTRGKKKPKDAQGWAYTRAAEAAEKKRKQKQLGPQKTYKKRK